MQHWKLANAEIRSRLRDIGEKIWQPGQDRYRAKWQDNWAYTLYHWIIEFEKSNKHYEEVRTRSYEGMVYDGVQWKWRTIEPLE